MVNANIKKNETQMKFGDVKVTTRALGACLQGSRVRLEEGLLHLWRVPNSKDNGRSIKGQLKM